MGGQLVTLHWKKKFIILSWGLEPRNLVSNVIKTIFSFFSRNLFRTQKWYYIHQEVTPPRVRGGTHGHIRLQACTVDISDSEPDKFGSIPESSWTNPTLNNYVLFKIVQNTNFNLFFSRFRSQLSLFVWNERFGFIEC